MSEGGLEDCIKSRLMCDEFNKLVDKVKDKELELLDYDFSIHSLELTKYIILKSNYNKLYCHHELLNFYHDYYTTVKMYIEDIKKVEGLI